MSDNSQLIIRALELTDPELYIAVDAEQSFKNLLIIKGARVAKYRQYERGDHDANLTDQMKKILRVTNDDAQLEELTDNYVRIVVDKMAGRLSIENIKTDNEAADEWLEELKQRNRFERLTGTAHRSAIREGDSYVLISKDVENGLVKWTSEPAYDGFGGMVVIFGDDQQPVWACKLWSEAEDNAVGDREENRSSTVIKIIVYQPTRISYFDGEVNGSEVTKWKEDKLWQAGKIPIVHIANARDNYNSYGTSEVRTVYPLQNLLNRTIHSMLAAAEFSGFKTRVSIGLELDVEGIIPGAVLNMVLLDKNDNVITSPSDKQLELLKAVRIEELGETDMSQYIAQIEKIVQEISQTSQTPIYGVTVSGNISGEALKQLEIGLVGKVERFQRENTEAWEQLISLTAHMQKVFGDVGTAPEFTDVELTWKSAELRDTAKQIELFIKMWKDTPGLFSDKFYRERIGNLLGLGEEELNEENERFAVALQGIFDEATGGLGVPTV
jgi:hypothetical protein